MGLQLTELGGQRVELSMGVFAQVSKLFVLLLDLLMQGIDFGKRAIAWTGYSQGHAGADAGEGEHHSSAYTQDTPAKSLVGEVQCSRHLPCT
ncbi:hypothetical protein GCM10007862_22910 [Dyella lipolytica]|nr:hypothetical protein GCM10007862_22910 [Dyella lipolytica]